MIDELLEDLESEMKGTGESLRRDLNRVRTGRASASLLDGLMVSYYGSATPLNKLANVSVPESRLLVVQPFDQGSISEIQKAILSSDLGLSPADDGKIIRVPIPELTEERRRELVRQVRKEGENHRVSARNHRRDTNEMLKQLLADKEISEDELRKAHEKVEEITKKSTEAIDQIVKAKEEDIMAV